MSSTTSINYEIHLFQKSYLLHYRQQFKEKYKHSAKLTATTRKGTSIQTKYDI